MRARVLVIAALLMLSGCGGSSPQLTPIERDELLGFVDRARDGARAGDLTATDNALEALRARVRELRGAGRLNRETAEQLLKYSAVTQLRARATLRSEPPAAPAPAPESEPGPPAAPEAEPGGGGDDKGDEKRDDKDKGNGKD